MALLSVCAGLRASEIAGLSWDHVLTADGSAVAEEIDLPRQITKGARRARVIPVHDELKTALEALRTVWPDRVTPGQPVVFAWAAPVRSATWPRPFSSDLTARTGC